MAGSPRGERRTWHGVVARTQWLTPALVRVVLTGDELRELPDLSYTDHYVKIHFQESSGRSDGVERRPVTRTYTIRWFDRETNELAIDFVVHGSEGLAGPWAAAARPGDPVAFSGPGGAWAPDPTADVHLLVGDESAVPAIAAALEVLPPDAVAEVFVEVEGPGFQPELRSGPGTLVHWVHRGHQPYGEPLARAVRCAPFPAGRVAAFVHGNAGMVKDLRRYLFLERELGHGDVSISGYWRTNYTEDRWQATKREFVAAMESEEAASVA
jgi:NADPH-dependent ferric siderophore reductase